MLIEEQVIELLQKCERILGTQLSQIRGNLRKADTRSAAIWELLVLEAASNIGPIEYEPISGLSPDIKLLLPHGRTIWIEAAYLYPRFWRQERQSSEIVKWLLSEARRRGIPPSKIFIRLDGVDHKKAGPIRKLPDIHEPKKILSNPELRKFYDYISLNPNDSHSYSFSHYSISIFYNPQAQGPHISWGGLRQEAPTRVKEHAIYRVLKEKAKKYKVRDPLLIFIGSDQSPALSKIRGPRQLSIASAVQAAFSEHRSLSAVVVVSIELKTEIFKGLYRQARAELFLNENSKNFLTPEDIESLQTINFNRWKYTSRLQKWESSVEKNQRRVTGTLNWRHLPMGLEIEVPANIVVDALAGKTSLAEAYELNKKHKIIRALEEGWVVDSCSFIEGNIEAGEAPKIVLQLTPPPISVFGPDK